MDRKFDYILERSINEQNMSFKYYLRDFMLTKDSWQLLLYISSQTDVYIFSGVIRNFLLGYVYNRDLDIVVKNINRLKLPAIYRDKIHFKRNSFGGYKLKIGMLNIDAWDIEKTWGIQQMKLKSTPYSLVKTAFFNFSAITYDFNKSRFIYDKCFVDFYRTHAMNIQYMENPNIPLCIVNTFYYAKTYLFPLKYELCRWIVNNYSDDFDYNEVQLKHFNCIIFNIKKIRQLVNVCCKYLPALEKNKTTGALQLF